jgi:hypothetical protein
MFRWIPTALFGAWLAGPARRNSRDDFTDGDFTIGTVWSGDDALFTVVGQQLAVQQPGAASYYLSTPSTQASDAQWDFFVNLKFSTSGANYADVYLMSDAADVSRAGERLLRSHRRNAGSGGALSQRRGHRCTT